MIADGAEGLVDAQARLQERIDELEAARIAARQPVVRDPDGARRVESYRLARVELERQLAAIQHAGRRQQIEAAIAEIDRRLAAERAR
jgi:hypothetical protein